MKAIQFDLYYEAIPGDYYKRVRDNTLSHHRLDALRRCKRDEAVLGDFFKLWSKRLLWMLGKIIRIVVEMVYWWTIGTVYLMFKIEKTLLWMISRYRKSYHQYYKSRPKPNRK